MTKAHHRKKAPEQVRRALLDCAARLAMEQGLAGISLQAVASAAGVTKGGLFYHFPNKQALIEAVCMDFLQTLDRIINEFLAQRPEQYGCFTRAYVETVFTSDSTPWASPSLHLLTESRLRALWLSWLQGRLTQHQATDADPALEVVRYAADGVWLADLVQGADRTRSSRAELRAQLLALIDKASP